MSALVPVSASRRIRSWRIAAVVAVVLVPLAFAGLFLASVGDPEAGLERVPVAIVNDDEAIIQTGDDGEEQYILAGRQLVTELTGSDSPADLDWQLTNDSDAAEMLASGEVYAILTVPSDFSEAILSTGGDDPQQASIEIRTDDAHSYVSGAVASALGDGMVRAFGSEITEQFIVGVFDEVGNSLTEAADAAQQLADGAADAASGAVEFADGVGSYTGGVASLASGARELDAGAEELDALVSGTQEYAAGVAQLSEQIAATTTALQSDPTNPTLLGTLAYLSALLEDAADGGSELAAGTSSAVTGIQGGISELASGATTLADNGAPLATGADELADGIGELADGSDEFATGLDEGAEAFVGEDGSAEALAAVAADPVGYELATDNEVDDALQAIATPLVPLALWIGAIVSFLALAPLTRGMLGSSAASGRLLATVLARASAVTAAQAVLLVGLLHVVAGVSWALLPATLVFSLLVALAFTAFHAAPHDRIRAPGTHRFVHRAGRAARRNGHRADRGTRAAVRRDQPLPAAHLGDDGAAADHHERLGVGRCGDGGGAARVRCAERGVRGVRARPHASRRGVGAAARERVGEAARRDRRAELTFVVAALIFIL